MIPDPHVFPSSRTDLLLKINPIVSAWTVNGIPIGDPLGNDWHTKTRTFSQAVEELGWDRALALPEVRRLLGNMDYRL